MVTTINVWFAHLLDFALKISIIFVVNHLGESDLFRCSLQKDDAEHPANINKSRFH